MKSGSTLSKMVDHYILIADEVAPPPVSVAHKSHIAKVMFLSALARPTIRI
jgi:hypothetical protein